MKKLKSNKLNNKPNEKPKKRSYQNNYEVIDAVKQCTLFRLTQEESLQKLSNMGYPLNERTLRRIKSKINDSTKKISPAIFEDVFFPHIHQIFDFLNISEKMLWEIISESKNHWEKMKALKMIRDFKLDKYGLFEASPVWVQMSKCIDAYKEKVANANSLKK